MGFFFRILAEKDPFRSLAVYMEFVVDRVALGQIPLQCYLLPHQFSMFIYLSFEGWGIDHLEGEVPSIFFPSQQLKKSTNLYDIVTKVTAIR